MNALEVKYALQLGADIEARMGELYATFAGGSMPPQDAQFWRLLSYEEQTHSQMMLLVREHVADDFDLPEETLPEGLRSHLAGLQKFHEEIVALGKTPRDVMMDPTWQVSIATDLEKSELDTLLEWLMKLPVAADIRALIQEMTRYTHDHAERIRKFGVHVANQVLAPAGP